MFLWVIKMIQLHRIGHFQGINFNKTDKSKKCKLCHYNYFNNGFKSYSKICNWCNWGLESFGNFAIVTSDDDVSYIFSMSDMTEEDVIELISDFEFDK